MTARQLGPVRRGALVGGLSLALSAVGVARGAARTHLPPLFGSHGIAPTAVRQGAIGSCFIFATIAGLAERNPGRIEASIRALPSGDYRVAFARGPAEIVSPADVVYARRKGFDRSTGLWASLLFRAYAQRVERAALLEAVEADNSAPFFLRAGVLEMLREPNAAGDLLFGAYDRSLRAAIGTRGQIDAASLRAHLRLQLDAVQAPAGAPAMATTLLNAAKQSILNAAMGQELIQTLAQAVQQNPEAFGAYRAVNNGGELIQAMRAWTGDAQDYVRADPETVARILAPASDAGDVITAATASHWHGAAAAPAWWVPNHAYTVLGFDAARQAVQIRNPWGTQPAPNGESWVSLADFQAGFIDLVTAPFGNDSAAH